jgi:hypothetical protein
MPFVAKRIISSLKGFKTKKSNLKHWLMILPFVLLLVGLVATALFLGMNQDLRQQAALESCIKC